MNMKWIGLQLYSVREALDQDLFATLNSVADIGYRCVEFPNMSAEKQEFLLTNSAEVRRQLDVLGVKTACVSIAACDLAEIDRYIEAAKELECKNIAVPIGFFRNQTDVLRLAEALDRVGDRCRTAGLQLHYHNHFHEFADMGGFEPLELLMEHVDPVNLHLELDVYWTARAGRQPLDVFRRWKERISLVHLKNISKDVHPLNLFDLIPAGTEIDESVFVNYALNPSDFVEIGSGALDIGSFVREMSVGSKVEHFIVEQDYSSIGPFNSAKRSFDALKALMRA